MQLLKLISLREGQRRVVSRQLEKFKNELSTSESTTLLQILSEKAETIKSLNEKIVNHADATDIETELDESEEYSIELEMKLRRLQDEITTRPGSPPTTMEQNENNHNRCDENPNTEVQMTETDVIPQVSLQTQNTSCNSSFMNHKLPKLSLPTFHGEIAQWQTFWDCFESSVHLNPSLSDVQKFSYLRSLLHGAAASSIAGFPLTHANYVKAVDLLRQRFGQPHKIINTYMQSLLELPKTQNTLTSLRCFHDKMETYIRGLESLGQLQESYGDLLVPIILDKMHSEIRRNMARDHGNNHWKMSELRLAIAKEISVLEAGESVDTEDAHAPTASFFAGTRNKSIVHNNRSKLNVSHGNKKPQCPFCGDQHMPNDCKKVSSIKNRIDIVKRNRLCFNCLGNHQVSFCQSHYRCRHCQRKHHTSICEQQTTRSTLNPDAAPFHKTNVRHSDTAILHATTQPRRNVLLKTAIAKVSYRDHTTDANILFDEGAQRSFITEKLAERLQLQPTGTDVIHLASFGASTQNLRHMATTTLYLVTNKGERIHLNVLIVPTIAVPLQNVQRDLKPLSYLRGLKLAHPVTEDDQFEIALLIGADYYWEIVQNRTVRGRGPTAVQSKIGYLLSGPLPVSSRHPENTHYMMKVITSPPDVFDLERFWKLESIGIAQEEDCDTSSSLLDAYKENCITLTDGRYSAKLPWKEDHQPLPTNYDVTRKRTESMIRRLRKEPLLLRKYGEIINDQKGRGFIEEVEDSSISQNQVHYIPHHGVKKDSVTTPIRIVYDCSCRQTHDHPSLNDCLQSTPPELNDLTGILMRFRMNKYAVSTDIEKAFLHVGLDEKDRDVTRFLWLSDSSNPDSPLTTYRFKAVLFGATCSPFILSATILKHLESNKDNWVSKHLERDIYVDNIISSFSQESDVTDYYRDTRTLMSGASFNLRSWNSNSRCLREMASTENVLDTDESTKVLGMRWDAERDMISFPQKQITITDMTTKREILQHTSRLYDPLGLLTPITIRAKIVLQELWKLKYTWDTPLPDELQQRWHAIAKDMNAAASSTFSRYLFRHATGDTNSSADGTSLHVFCDASVVAYGATVYICKGDQSALVMSKSRVAPLKKLTLPRMELMAAVIGARLVKHVQQELCISKIFLWSDSQIVLHWLQTAKLLQRFVRNRVTEIHKLTQNRKWRYCPTNDNPADLLTRGISAQQFSDNALWLNGPTWITDTRKWPTWNHDTISVLTTTADNLEHGEAELSVNSLPANTVFGIHTVIDVSRFGNLGKLLRVTAYVTTFIRNCRTEKSDRGFEPLSVSALHQAERMWIRSCQISSYKQEIDNLKSNCGSRLPLIKQLRLFIDNHGYLRCGGRIHNAPLPEVSKFPYLLPSKHPFTRLVVLDAHERLLHSGENSTITFIRQKFWIPSVRQYVTSVLRRCVTCRKVNGKPYTAPESPPLPKVRVDDVTPFTVTGVDFSGALYVRDRNGEETKTYICLFTCASTRAVHLELVQDLSADSFLQAFRRFCSRKSLPRVMISDNATTYMSAANYLQALFQSQKVQDELNGKGTEWRFIPKRAPWYGGWWERLIGLTKTALKKVLGRSYVSYEELQTIVTEIEAILNDRPLTYVTSGETDTDPLTPAHLLYGRRMTTLPYTDPPHVPATDTTLGSHANLTRRANSLKTLINKFRERWKHEYLTALREHHHTSGRKQQTITVGDVVQIHEETPRSRWKLAIVEELVYGRDGLVRSAKIRTKNGVTNRPIVKLYPLEVIS